MYKYCFGLAWRLACLVLDTLVDLNLNALVLCLDLFSSSVHIMMAVNAVIKAPPSGDTLVKASGAVS